MVPEIASMKAGESSSDSLLLKRNEKMLENLSLTGGKGEV